MLSLAIVGLTDLLKHEEYIYLSKDEEIKMALKHLNTLSKEEELYQESLTA